MHIDRLSSIASVPLKTARAQDTVIDTHISPSFFFRHVELGSGFDVMTINVSTENRDGRLGLPLTCPTG